MKICIFGAGAIGGLVGAKLAIKGDAEVSLIARGAHLAAMRERGLCLKSEAGATTIKVTATSDPDQVVLPEVYVVVREGSSVESPG